MTAAITSDFALGRLGAEQATESAGIGKLQADAREVKDRADVKRVADEFESLFLNMVLKSMRNTVQKSGLVDGGNAEDIYRSMLDDEYAKLMATQRQTGIADQIEDFMLKAKGLREVAQARPPGALKAYRDAALQNEGKRATIPGGEVRSRPARDGLPVATRVKAL